MKKKNFGDPLWQLVLLLIGLIIGLVFSVVYTKVKYGFWIT